MLVIAEILGHAALFGHAALERNPLQIASQVIGPLVIGTDELVGIALGGAQEFSAPVRATVLEDMDGAVFGARDNDRDRADVRTFVVARVRYFRFQRDEVPRVSFEDPLDFPVMDGLAGVDPI